MTTPETETPPNDSPSVDSAAKPANPPASDPPKPLTKDEIVAIVQETIAAKTSSPPSDKPSEDDKPITMAQARKMVEEASKKALEGKKELPKREAKQEPEKPPVTMRRLTKMLWGSEE
jgi:hypothetical protein